MINVNANSHQATLTLYIEVFAYDKMMLQVTYPWSGPCPTSRSPPVSAGPGVAVQASRGTRRPCCPCYTDCWCRRRRVAAAPPGGVASLLHRLIDCSFTSVQQQGLYTGGSTGSSPVPHNQMGESHKINTEY